MTKDSGLLKYAILFGSLFFVLACCTGTKPAEQEVVQSDTLQTDTVVLVAEGAQEPTRDPEPDFEPDYDPTYDDSLKKYFTEEQTIIIKKAITEHESIRTAPELARFYMVTLPRIAEIVNKQIGVSHPDLYSGDDSPSAQWGWFEQYFPWITFGVLCSECSYEAITGFGDLPALAGQTEEQEDDLFFDLAQYVYKGSYDGRGTDLAGEGGWYSLQGCHFCNTSMVGSGQYKGVLDRLEKAAPAQALFGSVMDIYRGFALDVKYDHYSKSKTDVLSEIKQMLKCKITADERTALKATLDQLSSSAPGAQFDCATKDCDFGDAENY